MTFNVFTLALLVFGPMFAGLAVALLARKRLGKPVSVLLGIAVLIVTAWAILTFFFGAELGLPGV